MITADRLKELVRYKPETGDFTWLVSTNRRIRVGDKAGCLTPEGKIKIRLDGRLYIASRLAWLYMTGSWPANIVDHKDCNPSNNKWNNLRAATLTQNQANSQKPKNNTSGFKGVSFNKKTGKWVARIALSGKQKYLGQFETPEAAHVEYVKAAKRASGAFARAE